MRPTKASTAATTTSSSLSSSTYCSAFTLIVAFSAAAVAVSALICVVDAVSIASSHASSQSVNNNQMITWNNHVNGQSSSFGPASSSSSSQQQWGALLAPTNNTKSQQYNAFIDECIRTHNEMRRRHGVPELQASKKLTRFARRRAKYIANSDGAEFRHPDNLAYGENLAWHSDADRTCASLVKLWYDERDLYRFDVGHFDTSTGHFTQLVWKSTTRVGCAKAYSSGPRGGVYLVCNYDPPGNWVGEALDNVFNVAATFNNKPFVPSSSSSLSTTTPLVQRKPLTIATTTTTTTTSVRPTTTTIRPKITVKYNTYATVNKPPLNVGAAVTMATANNNNNNKPQSTMSNKKKKKNKNKNKKKNNVYTSTTNNSTTTITTTTTTTFKPRAQGTRA